MRDGSQELAGRLGYAFQDPKLLELALTHRSFVAGRPGSNERLEFLGDAALGVVVSEGLYRRFPEASEGNLTALKAHFVQAGQLAQAARALGIGSCLRLGKGEDGAGGRDKERLLADAFEAVVGAVFLDGGLPAARSVVERAILGERRLLEAENEVQSENSKAALQEWLQARGLPLPEYADVSEDGPPHEPIHRVELRCGRIVVQAVAATKKGAEKQAAAQCLERLRADEAARARPATEAAASD